MICILRLRFATDHELATDHERSEDLVKGDEVLRVLSPLEVVLKANVMSPQLKDEEAESVLFSAGTYRPILAVRARSSTLYIGELHQQSSSKALTEVMTVVHTSVHALTCGSNQHAHRLPEVLSYRLSASEYDLHLQQQRHGPSRRMSWPHLV
jgi:hypothetical protein